MPSIFTQIINKEIPCNKIAENDQFIAFLDINPNAKGHTLCVPKQEINKIFDMPETLYLDLMRFSKVTQSEGELNALAKQIANNLV